MDGLIDRVLGDRYRIKSVLGRQIGRRTLLAQDLRTEMFVVLKLLLFGPDFGWDDLKLFEREAEVLKSLDLPAIPKYLDCFDVDTELGKGFVLVQTYIEAKSLQNWLDAGRTFSEQELISIAKSLLAILDYLHTRQPPVIHRDIKPSNILLGNRSGHSPGEVYLIDFGSVKTAATQSSTMTIVGTYGYMPPEQFGGQATPGSDLYALGATIICLATGQQPNELPQRDLQIVFADRVKLSPHQINWLKWMTNPSIDSRLSSASQALIALDNPAQQLPQQSNIVVRSLTVAAKPFGSKIKINRTRQMLEIVIPPKGFHVGLIYIIFFAIAWNSITLIPGIIGGITALKNWNIWSINWSPNLLWGFIFFSAFVSIFVLIGLSMIWGILFTLAGTRKLRITDSTISLSSAIFGLEYSRSPNAAIENITKLELTPLFYAKGSEGENVPVLPQLNIWAGTKKFALCGESTLTKPELEWLFYELTNWLDLK